MSALGKFSFVNYTGGPDVEGNKQSLPTVRQHVMHEFFQRQREADDSVCTEEVPASDASATKTKESRRRNTTTRQNASQPRPKRSPFKRASRFRKDNPQLHRQTKLSSLQEYFEGSPVLIDSTRSLIAEFYKAQAQVKATASSFEKAFVHALTRFALLGTGIVKKSSDEDDFNYYSKVLGHAYMHLDPTGSMDYKLLNTSSLKVFGPMCGILEVLPVEKDVDIASPQLHVSDKEQRSLSGSESLLFQTASGCNETFVDVRLLEIFSTGFPGMTCHTTSHYSVGSMAVDHRKSSGYNLKDASSYLLEIRDYFRRHLLKCMDPNCASFGISSPTSDRPRASHIAGGDWRKSMATIITGDQNDAKANGQSEDLQHPCIASPKLSSHLRERIHQEVPGQLVQTGDAISHETVNLTPTDHDHEQLPTSPSEENRSSVLSDPDYATSSTDSSCDSDDHLLESEVTKVRHWLLERFPSQLRHQFLPQQLEDGDEAPHTIH